MAPVLRVTIVYSDSRQATCEAHPDDPELAALLAQPDSSTEVTIQLDDLPDQETDTVLAALRLLELDQLRRPVDRLSLSDSLRALLVTWGMDYLWQVVQHTEDWWREHLASDADVRELWGMLAEINYQTGTNLRLGMGLAAYRDRLPQSVR